MFPGYPKLRMVITIFQVLGSLLVPAYAFAQYYIRKKNRSGQVTILNNAFVLDSKSSQKH
jgi:hypothetical protein